MCPFQSMVPSKDFFLNVCLPQWHAEMVNLVFLLTVHAILSGKLGFIYFEVHFVQWTVSSLLTCEIYKYFFLKHLVCTHLLQLLLSNALFACMKCTTLL